MDFKLYIADLLNSINLIDWLLIACIDATKPNGIMTIGLSFLTIVVSVLY